MVASPSNEHPHGDLLIRSAPRSIVSTPSMRRIQVSWRRAKLRWAGLVASTSPSSSCLEANRRPRGSRGAGALGLGDLLHRAASHHRVNPCVDPSRKQLGVDGQPDEQGRMAQGCGPQPPSFPVRRGGSNPARCNSKARAMRLRSLGWIVALNVGVELGVQCRRSLLRHLLLDLACEPRSGTGGRKVEVAERRAHVEAGAADHDRPPPFRQQAVDLAMGQLGEATGAELVANA